MRLVQICSGDRRRVGLVEEPRLRLIRRDFPTIYELAFAALGTHTSLRSLIKENLGDELLDYDAVYSGQSEWKLMSPLDHPNEPARCAVSGTGLTHLGSARQRQNMHFGADEQAITDSMKMFRWGVEGGKPQPGKVGIAPEWFYKGPGMILRACGQPLDMPFYAEDGGEEAEIAGLYIVGPDSKPYRIGMAIGNEFSDHRFEKRNYLNLAGSKLRTCSIGPELVIDAQFQTVPGKASIVRHDKTIWSKDILTGEAEMCHSLANIEHHHFKFEAHRRPGDVHVHFFGAHSLSFGDGIELQDGDEMRIEFEGFGRALRNPLRRIKPDQTLISAHPLS